MTPDMATQRIILNTVGCVRLLAPLEVDRLGAALDLLMASQENSLYKNPDYSNDYKIGIL